MADIGAPRHYHEVVVSVRPQLGHRVVTGGENPVVTGRKIGLQASSGKRFGKKKVGAGVVTRC